MKRSLAAIALTATLIVAGCSEPGPADGASPAADAAAEAAAPAVAPTPPAAVAARVAGPAQPAAPGAPAFAVIYPGGELSKPATVAQGPEGPGGIVEFTTSASPEAVIAFYKHRAETAGLKPINAMSQGEARAYSAGDGANGRGQLMSVIATPLEGGPTSVQLDWTRGR